VHPASHILSGWCAANALPLGPRDRMLCMVAAIAADADALTRIAGQRAYEDYHHTLSHNALAGVVIAAALTAFSVRRIVAAFTYIVLFHLHLLMDLIGSGRDWDIRYFWPFSNRAFTTSLAWDFDSWQNKLIGLALIALTFVIAWRWRRTPLEALMPSLDRQLVARFRRRET
jgi:inner membrane protein